MHNKQFNSALERKVNKAIQLSAKRVKTVDRASQAHKMITKSELIQRAQSKGHCKNFINVMLTEIIAGEEMEGVDPIIPKYMFKDWIYMHCYKPITQHDFDQADKYYNLDSGLYEMHSNHLYNGIKKRIKRKLKQPTKDSP